ncbi:MAG: hypothetical protein L3J68_03700 [Thermoplasmata archaeon]|nr:hypothetical protein [Thermoplasmata archaeon]
MSEPAEPFRNPYPPTQGGSTPGHDVTPAEGTADLWAFFWVSVVSVVIIAAFGLAAWLYVHH